MAYLTKASRKCSPSDIAHRSLEACKKSLQDQNYSRFHLLKHDSEMRYLSNITFYRCALSAATTVSALNKVTPIH